MLIKTKGIVIHYLKYRETSLLVTIYTAQLGIASYIENGVRSAKAKHKMALFQPLTLLDMEVYSKPGKGLNRISELKCYFPYQQIPFDIAKSSIALFLSEVLNKVLKEEEANPLLFQFLEDSLQFLDSSKEHFENFHIQFLWNLTAFLGFSPGNAKEFYQQLALARTEYGRPDHVAIFDQIALSDYGSNISLTKIQRKEILAAVIRYYQIHVASFGELRSLQILQEVLA
jgi:DNA repair protein RecO (recombination protein O)